MVISRRAVATALSRIGTDLWRDPAGAVFAIGIAALLALTVIGLPLAIAGWFRPLVVLPSVAVGWGILLLAGWERGLDRMVQVTGRGASVVALLVVVGFGGFAALHAGQHMLTDRDPGIYLLTGRWLADHGSLLFDAGVPESVVAATGGIGTGVTQGVYPRFGGEGYFQFTHLTAVVLAVGQWLGGDGLMLRVPALPAALALLGVFVLARRLVGSRLALLALGTLGLHPAALYFAKDAYSEYLGLEFLVAALTLWMGAGEVRSPRLWLWFGALAGATTVARIDGWVTLAALLAGVIFYSVWRRPGVGGPVATVVPFAVGVVVVGGIGLLDLAVRSPLYLSALGTEAGASIGLVAALLVLGAITVWLTAQREVPGDSGLRSLLAGLAAGAIAALGLFALFLRPRLGVDRGVVRDEAFGALQVAEGLTVDLTRTYAEQSMLWLTRYQGYLLVLATLAAVAGAVWVAVRRADRIAPVATTLVGVALLYLWRPSITPDHFWAMRRFLPVVLPLGAVLLAWGAARVLAAFGSRPLVVGAVAVPFLAGGFAMVTAGATVATARTQVPLLDATHQVCDALPPGSIAVMDDDLGEVFLLAVRTVCGVPTMVDDRAQVVAAARDAGLITTAVVSPSSCVGGPELLRVERPYFLPEATVSRPPSGSVERLFRASVKALDPEARPVAPVPDDAIAAIAVAVAVEALPAEDAILATLGDATTGLRVRLGRDGTAEVVVDTTAGRLGVVIAFETIADGRPRVIGGYVTPTAVFATCDGYVVAATDLSSPLLPLGGDPVIRPLPSPGSGLVQYPGEVELVLVRLPD